MNAKKKAVISAVLFFSAILISGCQTIKGIGKGASEGIKKDWQAIVGADDKMREVLW